MKKKPVPKYSAEDGIKALKAEIDRLFFLVPEKQKEHVADRLKSRTDTQKFEYLKGYVSYTS